MPDQEQPLGGIQGEEGDVELPADYGQAQAEALPQAVPVGLKYYGENFGETHRDANYGPNNNKLTDDDVAISPDVEKQLGLNLGDWVWVGPQLRRFNDRSFISPGRPNTSTVEVRDHPSDGRTMLRKATPDEVSAFSPSYHFSGEGMPTAQQAAVFTGQDPNRITAQSVNQMIQPQIEGRSPGLIAGEPTAASLEEASQLQGATQLADESGAAAGDMGDAGGYGITMSDTGTPNRAYATPDNGGRPLPNGSYSYNNGDILYHPATDMLEWRGPPGITFTKQGQFGKVIGRQDNIKLNKATGEYYDYTTGKTIQMPGQSPAYDRSQSVDANLQRLSPRDAFMVRQYLDSKAIPTGRFGQWNSEFLRLSPYIYAVNPEFDPRKAQVRQNAIANYSIDKPGNAAYSINSWNQALTHAGSIWDLAKKLPETKFPSYNALMNALNTQWGSDAQGNYEAFAHALGTEIEKATTGAAPSVTATSDIEKRLKAAGSKQQIEGILRDVYSKQAEGALERHNFGYRRAMGIDMPTEQLISPEAADSLNKFGVHDYAHRDLRQMQGVPPVGGAGAATAGPAPIASPAEQAAIAELTRQGKLVNPDTIKQAVRIMQGQP